MRRNFESRAVLGQFTAEMLESWFAMFMQIDANRCVAAAEKRLFRWSWLATELGNLMSPATYRKS